MDSLTRHSTSRQAARRRSPSSLIISVRNLVVGALRVAIQVLEAVLAYIESSPTEPIGLPEDVVVKIFEKLYDGEPSVKHREQHVVLKFDPVWSVNGARIEFQHHTLTTSSLRLASMPPVKLREYTYSAPSGTGAAPLPDSRTPAKTRVVALAWPSLTQYSLLALRYFAPQLRSLTVKDLDSRPRAPAAVLRRLGLPALKSLTVLTHAEPAKLFFFAGVFASSLTSLVFTFYAHEEKSIDLSPLHSLNHLTVLLYLSLYTKTVPALLSVLSRSDPAHSPSSSFRLTLEQHPESATSLEGWRRDIGRDFAKKVFEDKRVRRIRAVDATALRLGFERLLGRRRKDKGQRAAAQLATPRLSSTRPNSLHAPSSVAVAAATTPGVPPEASSSAEPLEDVEQSKPVEPSTPVESVEQEEATPPVSYSLEHLEPVELGKQEEATPAVSPLPEQAGVPEDIVLKILKHLLLDEAREAARTSLTRCCLASKHFLLLARPILKQHHEQHLVLEFDSVRRDTGIRVEFQHQTLTPASATRATTDPDVASKIRSTAFRTVKGQKTHWGKWEASTQAALGTLIRHLRSPVSLSLPVLPDKYAYGGGRAFPLPASRSQPDDRVIHLDLPDVYQDNLLMLRIFPSVRTLVVQKFSIYEDNTLDLSPLVFLNNLATSSKKVPPTLRLPASSHIASSGSAPHTATSFRLTLKRHKNSQHSVSQWRSAVGKEFVAELFKDKQMRRLKAVDAAELGMRVEPRKKR
ncbi:hypothetical protein JCM8547_005736 [Rhodosporidiobolus lusitaniae]